MGKMYEDWNKLFCDELCTEIEKFKKHKTKDQLCVIKDLIEVKNGLAEMEMDGAIRRIAEDRYGYDSNTESFRDTDQMYEFAEMFNASRGGRGGTRRRRDSRGRYMAMGDPRHTVYYPPEPDEYPWEYPYYMMNDGRREYSGERKRDRDDDDMMNTGRNGNRGNGRGGRVNGGDDDMYMLRQENGRPIMTPYNMAHDTPKKLTDKQYQEWMDDLQNEDGTDGPHWTKPQVEAEAKRAGIDISEYGIEAVWACTNFLYSDFSGVAAKYNVSKPSFFINMAMAFLDDKDYEGSGGIEKLATYYYKIAKADE